MKFTRRSVISLFAVLTLAGTTYLAQAATNPQVLIKTNMGDIVVELYPQKAPKSVANFLQYVKSKQYSGTIFHRVIQKFMIQGGGLDKNMVEKPTREPIENEASNGLKNERYALAMARKGDPHSATAQFFINTSDNSRLDFPAHDGWGYTVFGKVIKGMNVVDKIELLPTSNSGDFQNVPVSQVVINSASVLK